MAYYPTTETVTVPVTELKLSHKRHELWAWAQSSTPRKIVEPDERIREIAQSLSYDELARIIVHIASDFDTRVIDPVRWLALVANSTRYREEKAAEEAARLAEPCAECGKPGSDYAPECESISHAI